MAGRRQLRLTVAEGGRRAGKPDGDTSDLGRSADTAERVRRRPLGEKVRVLVEVDAGHTGADVAGGDAVDANVVRSPFCGQISTHLEDSRLGSVVGDPVMVSVDDGARHGGDEDDGTVNVRLLIHLAGGGTSSEEDAGGVDVKDLLESLDGVVKGVVGLRGEEEVRSGLAWGEGRVSS